MVSFSRRVCMPRSVHAVRSRAQAPSARDLPPAGGFGHPAAMASAATPEERVVGDIHELTGPIESPYANEDLAPTSKAQRKWAMKDIAALWISMSACVPTYMLASSLIS